VRGVCGKTEETADLQDLLIYVTKGISLWTTKLKELGANGDVPGRFICEALFTTITNVCWDNDRIIKFIKDAIEVRNQMKDKFFEVYRQKYGKEFSEPLHDSATWAPSGDQDIWEKAKSDDLRITADADEDIRSLRQMLIIGCKGIAAYADHAALLGYQNQQIYDFIIKALDSTTRDLSASELLDLIMEAGSIAVTTMALLDEANTSTYGHPEITEVNIGVGNRPGILISGHDLKDMEELLKQTEGTGVDVYTHGEMLPANYYPAFKKYEHFIGNYGGSWWHQNREFESFNGPIILTTNCLVPLRKDNTYLDRLFTTGVVAYPGAKHIADRPEGGSKDFSEVIELAKRCPLPTEIEKGKIVGGFAHQQVLSLADKVIEAVKSGAIKRFIVMAGCDGRQKAREYFTEVAKLLPKDAVILTAGCAKYRYNKLDLGDINGIPRILDAGQCNDCYSLAVIALKLKEAFGLDDINKLPLSFDIAWYEQKAVAVLLALLHLGVKGIRLGPTLPGFISPGVANILVEKFDIKQISEPDADVSAMMQGM
jgi:hydroxylamine reductase